MADLRLSTHGRKVLADWIPSASPADQKLVADVLETVADGTWRTPRWYYTPDAGDRRVFVIQPRDNLFISIKFSHDNKPDEPDTFDLVSVVALPPPSADD